MYKLELFIAKRGATVGSGSSLLVFQKRTFMLTTPIIQAFLVSYSPTMPTGVQSPLSRLKALNAPLES